MKIDNLIKNLEIQGISCNSKDIKEGFMFVAIKGNSLDGHDFIQEAMQNGARCIVAEKDFPCSKDVKKIVVKDTRKALVKLAKNFYKEGLTNLKLIGITGTNGKTTTSYLIESILKEAHFNPGVIGTINYRFKTHSIEAKNTTPGVLELHSFLNTMAHKGADSVVMEVSSHAIHQGRIEGLKFNSAVFTNITREHLDYHNSMQDYKDTKAKLFKNLPKHSFAILNIDDNFGRTLFKEISCKRFTYSISKKADVNLKDVRTHLGGLSLTVDTIKGEVEIESALFGRHNIYNILAAIACSLSQDISLKHIKKGIEGLKIVPGRLQQVVCGQPFSVFIDYAHTEDALRNVLSSLREICKGRILTVFGCGGDRDKSKRPKMGKAASELSDMVFITNDNPRTESAESIVDEILVGIDSSDAHKVILDRRQAIKEAIDTAKKDDCVLIAGKGHENYQVLKNKRIPFDDYRVTKSCLQLKTY